MAKLIKVRTETPNLTRDILLSHFDGIAEACEALGITRQMMWKYHKKGIPHLVQYKIEWLTNRKILAYDPKRDSA